MKPLSAKNKNKGWWWIIVIAAVLSINLIASIIHKRIDLTNERRFTISSPVKRILAALDAEVEVEIFLKGDMPSGFKKLSTSAAELLQEFKEHANGKIRYKVLSADDPMPGTSVTYADTLSSLGIIPIDLKVQLKAGEQSQYIYPAALVHYKDKIQAVNLYSGPNTISNRELNSAEALLEYKFANAIYKVVENHKPLIAYSFGNGEPTGDKVYDLTENVLKKNYDLFRMNIAREPVIPDTFKLLMIVKPTIRFTDAEKLKIDQFVMHGGKVLWFVDRLEAEMDSLQIKNQVIAYDRNLNLEDLLFKYGVRINPDLLMDLQCDYLRFVNAQSQDTLLPWNYFPLLESGQNSAVNKNVGLVEGKFTNSMDTVSAAGVIKTVLLHSSGNAKTIETPALISAAENRTAPIDEAYNKKDIITGVLLEGKFSSLYRNRISQQVMDSLGQYGTPFLTECINDNKMIVIADGDIVLNGNLKNEVLPMGVNPQTLGTQREYQFANKQFVENCLEYLINNAGLNEARAKDYTLRLLDPKKTNEEGVTWQIINLALPVFLIILGGMVYQWWRRKRYRI